MHEIHCCAHENHLSRQDECQANEDKLICTVKSIYTKDHDHWRKTGGQSLAQDHIFATAHTVHYCDLAGQHSIGLQLHLELTEYCNDKGDRRDSEFRDETTTGIRVDVNIFVVTVKTLADVPTSKNSLR
jgi:hypothetical protein